MELNDYSIDELIDTAIMKHILAMDLHNVIRCNDIAYIIGNSSLRDVVSYDDPDKIETFTKLYNVKYNTNITIPSNVKLFWEMVR